LVTEKVPPVWVHGVLSQVTFRDRMGYLVLAEFPEGEVRPTAILNLVVFAKELAVIQAKLASGASPIHLQEQLKVSLLLQADFHIPQGRFQSRILDIDPNYTLGELAITKRMILKRLQSDGLIGRNAQIQLPLLPLQVGLITAPDSAAFHDFMDTIGRKGYAFQVRTISAKMQGSETETSVLEALGTFLQEPRPDVVCIVRGGGARSDLNAFDSEALCRAVGLYPIPVLTGIGHEIDKSLLDLVAWQSCITPTDTAKFLLQRVEDAESRMLDVVAKIIRSGGRRIEFDRQRFTLLQRQFSLAVPRRLSQEYQQLDRDRQGLRLGVGKILMMSELRIQPQRQRLVHSIKAKIQSKTSALELLDSKIASRDPARILAQGYSISTMANGKVPTSSRELPAGSSLQTRFVWGTVLSRVD